MDSSQAQQPSLLFSEPDFSPEETPEEKQRLGQELINAFQGHPQVVYNLNNAVFHGPAIFLTTKSAATSPLKDLGLFGCAHGPQMA
jgi:hypothetical protein